MSRFTTIITVGLCTQLLWSMPAHAEQHEADMAAVFPQETVLFVGLSGMQQLDGIDDDNLQKRCLRDPEFRAFYAALYGGLDAFLQKMMREQGMPKELHDSGLRVLESLTQHPVGVGFIGLKIGEGGPNIDAAVVCRAGKAAAKMQTDLTTVLRLMGAPVEADGAMTRVQLPVPGGLAFGAVDDYFVLTIGANAERLITRGVRGEGSLLRDHAGLKAARQRIKGNDKSRTGMLFVNVLAARRLYETYLPMAPDVDAEELKVGMQIMDALGLEGLESICLEGHLVGGASYTGLFCHTPRGGRGLLATSGTKRLTEDDLALIPKDPTFAFASNIDLAGGFTAMMNGIKQAPPEVSEQIEGGLQQVEGMLGFKIADLLGKFGDTFVIYDAPENGGFWFTGITLIADCKDVDGLGSLVARMAGLGSAMAGEELDLSIRSQEHGKHTISFINSSGLPIPVAPAWAAYEGRVIMALYPQMVRGALDRLDKGERNDSLLANAEFKHGFKTLGELGTTVSYVDTREGAAAAYPWILGIAQAGVSMVQKEGIDVDITAMPSYRTVAQYIHNEVSSRQVFEDGTLFASFGNKPIGFSTFAGGQLATTGLGASIMIPALVEAREQAKKNTCDANIRSLAMLLLLYHQKEGHFPSDMNALDQKYPISFIKCPETGHDETDPLDADYVYIPGHKEPGSSELVIVYERFGNHGGDGAWALFLDGHGEYLEIDRLKALIAKSEAHIAAQNNAGE